MCAGIAFAADTAPTNPGFIAYRVSGEISFTKEILDFNNARIWGGATVEGNFSTGKPMNPMVSASAGIGYVEKKFQYPWANAGLGFNGTSKDGVYYSLLAKSSLSDFLPQLVGYVSKKMSFDSSDTPKDKKRFFEVALCGGVYLPIGDETYEFTTENHDRYSGVFVEPSVSSVVNLFGKGVELKAVFNYTATNQMVYGKTFESFQFTLYQKWDKLVSTYGSYKVDPWYPTVDGIFNFGVMIAGDTRKPAAAEPEKKVAATPAAAAPPPATP